MKKELKRIMCIDDEEDILDIFKICLETTCDFEVHCFKSGEEGLKMWSSVNPDLIMLDVMMPKINGPTVLQELRKQPELDNVPIIFVTARVQPSEIQEYLDIGAAGVINKPFDPIVLSSQVINIWEKFHRKTA